MRNKEFQKLLKKNKSKSNSGFTLTELLVGLFMSIFVVGALGFGLMTVLRTTQSETSKVAARNETSRALDFITDEIRRASTIETNLANANISRPTGAFNIANTNIDSSNGTFNSDNDTEKKIVFALDIPEVSSSATLDTDADATTPERIIYYLKSASGTHWKGPLVLYRWGPPLKANGTYDDGAWQEEALIDGIDDTHIVASPCAAGETLTPPLLSGTTPSLTGANLSTAATGFYACVDNSNTAAQLYITGETETALNSADTYTADTKAVARASTAPANNSSNFVAYTMSYRTLGAVYNCNPNDDSMWKMRTDFGSNPSDGDDTTSWIHQDNRQPQPIQIDTSNDLTITSVPVDPVDSAGNQLPSGTDCLSKGDETATGDASTEDLSDYNDPSIFPNGHTVSHTIKFVDESDSTTANNWHTFNGDPKTGSRDEPDVKGDGTVLILKNGSTISDSLIGYDYDDDSTGDQDSLGQFLLDNGYATLSGGTYTVANLNDNERIMAVEVGQDDSSHPGFDVQDSVFILSSDVFAKKYD